jgi:hypothetical protein
MKRPLLAALTAVMLLQACGGGFSSRLNPFNWFKRSAPTEVILVETGQTADLRPLVDRVISLNIDSYPGGAIVRATGLPPSQGWWDAELVARPVDENGVLVYDFHVFPPRTPTSAGIQQSREIAVAADLSTSELANVSQIVVQGANDARSARR